MVTLFIYSSLDRVGPVLTGHGATSGTMTGTENVAEIPDPIAAALATLQRELAPILGDGSARVLSRLMNVVQWRLTGHTGGTEERRVARGRDRDQIADVRAAFDRLWQTAAATDPEVQAHLGTGFVGFWTKCFGCSMTKG